MGIQVPIAKGGRAKAHQMGAAITWIWYISEGTKNSFDNVVLDYLSWLVTKENEAKTLSIFEVFEIINFDI